MAYIADSVFDDGLTTSASIATRIDIVDLDPGGTYSCVTTNTIGNKTSLTCTVANSTSGSGRAIRVPAINDGTVTDTSTATYWALTNASNTVIASGTLSASQAVTSGNTFTLDLIEVAIRDGVST